MEGRDSFLGRMMNERRGHISLMSLQGKRHKVGDEERSPGTSCDGYLGVNLIRSGMDDSVVVGRWTLGRMRSIQWGR